MEILESGGGVGGCLAWVFAGALPSNIHGKDIDDARNFCSY